MCYLDRDSMSRLSVSTIGPPPAALIHIILQVPEIHLVTAVIIKSMDQLFFVYHSIGANDAHEWHLAWIAFNDLVSIYSLRTRDGWSLFKFYICHPADLQYNAVNQR
jgi:hypothetical protein